MLTTVQSAQGSKNTNKTNQCKQHPPLLIIKLKHIHTPAHSPPKASSGPPYKTVRWDFAPGSTPLRRLGPKSARQR